MILQLPFKYANKFILEKPVELTFKIATLEVASLEILKCDLWGVGEKSIEEVNVAILYAAYIQARKDKYKKPKYTEVDAAFWISNMSKKSNELFYQAISELMGTMKNK